MVMSMVISILNLRKKYHEWKTLRVTIRVVEESGGETLNEATAHSKIVAISSRKK